MKYCANVTTTRVTVGGTIVAQGTPEQVAKAGKGHTARFLAEELRTSKYSTAKAES
jgi:excinuclease ABC subunit A